MKRWVEDDRAPVAVRALLEEAAEATAEAPPFAKARVFERVRPRSRGSRAWIPVAATAAAAVIAAVVWAPTPREVGTVARVTGDVRVETRPDGTLARAVSEAGGAIELASLGTLEFEPQTEIERGDEDAHAAWRFAVTRGALTSDVPRVARVGGYAIVAGDHEVRVVGTRFSVTRGPDDAVTVEVAHGVVRVVGPGVDRRVAAPGRYASARLAARAGGRDEGPRGDPMRSMAEAVRADGEDETSRVADAERDATEARAGDAGRRVDEVARAAVADRRANGTNETDRTGDAAGPRDAVPDADAEAHDAATDAEDATRLDPATEPTAAAPHDAAPTEAPDPDAAHRVAMDAYRDALDADPEEAARRLVVVAETHPVVRELALHRAARVLKDAGACGPALPRYEALIEEFADSALDLERRFDRAECLREMKRGVALAAALDDLERRPIDRARRAELSLMRAELARERGDLEGVLRAARNVPDDVAAAETATFLEAWSLLELDRTDEARTALARYARRWPQGRHAATARAWLKRFEEEK